jgi:RNA polymerase primary sigma factor
MVAMTFGAKANTRRSDVRTGSRSTDPYLREIAGIPLLTAAAEAGLSARIRTGDRSAVNELVVHNLRFVVVIARRYSHYGVPLEDLINEGNIGLIYAARRFDARRGYRFISYAVYWIRQAVLRYLDQKSRLVRVPVNKRRQLMLLARASERLPHTLGREPRLEEIARSIGINPRRIEWLWQMPLHAMPIEHPISADDFGHEADTLEDPKARDFEDRIATDLDVRRLASFLEKLDRRGADIVRRYYGLDGNTPETLARIGRSYGVTRERARQLHDRAMDGLRRLLEPSAEA